MTKKEKIKQILQKLDALEGISSSTISNIDEDLDSLTTRLINEEASKITARLSENAVIKILTKVSSELKKVKGELNVQPLISSIKELKTDLTNPDKEIRILDSRLTSSLNSLITQLSKIESNISNLSNTKVNSDVFSKSILDIRNEIESLIKNINDEETLKEKKREKLINELKDTLKEETNRLDEKIEKNRTELISKLGNRGGGNANRQINISSSIMSTRYTDINFTNSTTIGWTATDDNTNKRVNISASILSGGGGGSALTVKEADGSPSVSNVNTIVVSNGTLTDDGSGQVTVTTGGGGGGITRTTSVLSVSSTLAAAASTDYVFFPNVGIRLTLPTAINNSNLYTIKNIGSSSVLVATTAGQTIDGSSTALMPTTNESISLVSNGSVWGVV